jgi:hypothetical protein
MEPCQLEAGSRLSAVVWDLSVGGAYVVINPPPPPGSKVSLVFSLPRAVRPIRAESRVAWNNPPSSTHGCGSRAARLPPGCGLEFLVIDHADAVRIQEHVASLLPS